MADMIISAHGGKTRFHISDTVGAQNVFNAARNVEVAAWMLANRRDAQGRPLLLSNEIAGGVSNLSFEREFGGIISRLDLIAELLDENVRRVGINYRSEEHTSELQSLMRNSYAVFCLKK